MQNEDDDFQDFLGIEIEVYVKDGECFQVLYKGKPVRARVVDYDVVFPCTAHGLDIDTDGNYFMETVV